MTPLTVILQALRNARSYTTQDCDLHTQLDEAIRAAERLGADTGEDIALLRQVYIDWTRDNREWKIAPRDVEQALSRVSARQASLERERRETAGRLADLEYGFRDSLPRDVRKSLLALVAALSVPNTKEKQDADR